MPRVTVMPGVWAMIAGRLPRNSLGRTRALFFAIALLDGVVVSPMILISSVPGVLRVSGGVCLAAFAGWMVRGYRSQHFSALGDLIGALSLASIAVAVEDPFRALGLLYFALCFRALYGSTRRVLWQAVLFLLGHLAALVVVAALHYTALFSLEFAQAPGVVLIAVMMHSLAVSLTRQQSLTREATLARGAALLVRATVEGEVHAAALSTAAAVLTDEVAECDVRLAVSQGDTVVLLGAATGEAPAPRWSAAVEDIPSHLRILMTTPCTVSIDTVEARTELKLLHLGEAQSNLLVSPLLDEGAWRGALLVATDRRPADDTMELLSGLASQVTLALDRLAIRARTISNEARFRSLVHNSSDMIIVADARGELSYISPAAERVLGYVPEELVGTRLADLLAADDPLDVAFPRIAAGPAGPGLPMECRLRHRDGSWRHLEVMPSNLLADPAVGGVVLNTRDVTERKALEDQLRYQAFHDTLTGLPNRALFLDRLEHALTRRSGRREAAVFYLDIDDFKLVNDTLGHGAGDELLAAAARRLRDTVRESDTVARMGGDEFAILVEDTTDAAATEREARRIVDAFRAPFTVGGREIGVRCSVGVSTTTRDADAAGVIRDADVAMYAAKARGKGRHAIFQPHMREKLIDRVVLGEELRKALSNDELKVVYQPQVDIATSRMVGVEALVRWHHPTRGVIPPNDFIPVAEEARLITEVDMLVLRAACTEAKRWRDHGLGALRVSTNVSGRDFEAGDLGARIAAVLDETGFPARLLELEVTEGVALRKGSTAEAVLAGLRRRGVRIAIDDFGTGYSTLERLQRFPIDTIKIDRSFVSQVGSAVDDAPLVTAMIAMAHSLGAAVVAEGVETLEQLAFLRMHGCDVAQGYLISRPVPAESLAELLRSGQPATAVA